MNLPNKLTLLRVIMIPFFVAAMLTGFKWIALVLFVVASLTDLADGKIARKYNLVTDFGKFMDPLADKMLVISALICLVGMDRIWTWIVILIVAREFIISGFRLVAAEKGKVIAASMWGKFKTTFQMIMVIMMIIDVDYAWSDAGVFGQIYGVLTWIITIVAVALTIISLADYLVKNWSVMDGQL
ncbi:CDP-diacylglycerol--glycerol-3-phosphate 3-phosphatidyltransferase [Butyrivibrio fibrisolvens DSM 3071]|uniref:CDP-diacylglycerol--glycerol-3-phosphate 3-phosphatidyltransferase n=1 Tax=Butyrivibrio fibrisolvens DSM 3071 TaxID=1121131 RepID=A0A1M5X3C9_BUTFI|nr:CDP-diacylglycerol--glycerol-3-phosphate 3-phosphatidyltransferase [Butyrivibrio fibrisolvens]SHH94345.1 CDP-diacylglycerol--glycerol-3-phosphate 3-phosphatidyltransferase [Butyrivibrio fibrisolvens DSM 3071]